MSTIVVPHIINMFGLSTTYYATQGKTVYDSVRRISELGFSAVELGAAHEYESTAWATLKKLKMDFSAIHFSVHALFPPLRDKVWFNAGDGLQGVNKKIVDNLFTAGEIVQADFISIHPAIFNEIKLGDKIGGNFRKPIVGGIKNREKSQDNFMHLVEYACHKSLKTGVTLLIENLDATFLDAYPSSIGDFIEVFTRFPCIGMLFDVGHAIQTPFMENITALESMIKEVHLHAGRSVYGTQVSMHSLIKDASLLEPLIRLGSHKEIMYILEHGADVTEEEIVAERMLIEHVFRKGNRR